MSVFFRLYLGLLLLAPALTQAATLEIPGTGSNLSGIGVISGWKCEATALTVVIDGGAPIPLLHGSERGDTHGVCGDTPNGFLAIWNWALLSDGEHEAVAYDNGVEFARSTFTVGTLGEVFVQGARAEVRVEDFPSPGESTLLEWNESSQHFEVVPESPAGFAPVDQAAFDRLVVGNRAVSRDDSRFYVEFPSAGRLVEYAPGERYPGRYTYSNTGPNTGRLTASYDDGDVCTSQLTFTSATTATSRYTCTDGEQGGYSWRLESEPAGGGSAGSGSAGGQCTAGLVVNPGESCTHPTNGETFSVDASGSGRFGFISAGTGITIVDSNINGQTITFVASRNPDNSWTIERVA